MSLINRNSIFVLTVMLVLFASIAHAQRLPVIGSDSNSWGLVLNSYLLVTLNENGTLRQGLNATFGSLNISSNLIVLGNIYGEIPDAFKISNFTDAYNSRNDRFGNANFTALLPPYPTNATIQISASQVTGLGSLASLNSLGDDSINSSMIISGEITGPKIGENAVTTSKIADETIKDRDISFTAEISLSKLATGASGQIFVVNTSGNPSYVTLSGDASLTSLGSLTIANNAVTTDKIQDGAVTDSKIVSISAGKVSGYGSITTLAIGGGTNITNHISVTATNVATSEINNRDCDDLATVTVSGASVGDTVIASPFAVSNGIETKDLIWNAYISASNTVNIRACNPTNDDINIIDTQSWRIDVWKH